MAAQVQQQREAQAAADAAAQQQAAAQAQADAEAQQQAAAQAQADAEAQQQAQGGGDQNAGGGDQGGDTSAPPPPSPSLPPSSDNTTITYVHHAATDEIGKSCQSDNGYPKAGGCEYGAVCYHQRCTVWCSNDGTCPGSMRCGRTDTNPGTDLGQ